MKPVLWKMFSEERRISENEDSRKAANSAAHMMVATDALLKYNVRVSLDHQQTSLQESDFL